MKIKFNWGTGIVVAFLIMISGMSYLVSIAVRQNSDLVDKDYYQRSINYEQHIDEEKNTEKLAQKLSFFQSADTLKITFPNLANIQEYSGKIHFYSPVAENRDLTLPVKLNSVYSQVVDLKKLAKGRYQIKIDWSADKVKYYQEEDIVVE